MKKIGIGLVGTGWIGRVHAEQFQRVPQLFSLPGVEVKLQAVSDVIPELRERTARDFGFERQYENWQDLVADPEVTVVDICAPDVLHHDVSIAAAAAGKHVFCEKPLSMSPEQGRRMLDAVEKAGVCHMVDFNYRRYPAILYAKQLLEDGSMGDVYQIRANFSQDWVADPNAPWLWRFDKKMAPAGSISMIGCHVFDTARYLVGDITDLVADFRTVIHERPNPKGGKSPVDVDDISSVVLRFQGGATGLVSTSWVAYGRKHHFEWEINASRGSMFFNSERLNELQICEASDPKERQGFKTIYIGPLHPFGEAFGLKAGQGIGARESFLLQIYEMLRCVVEGAKPTPSFYDGLQADRLLAAAKDSVERGAWVHL